VATVLITRQMKTKPCLTKTNIRLDSGRPSHGRRSRKSALFIRPNHGRSVLWGSYNSHYPADRRAGMPGAKIPSMTAQIVSSIFGGAAMLVFAVSGLAVWFRMVARINRQRAPNQQLSCWWCTPIAFRSVLSTHQALYPESRLPSAILLSTCGLVLCFLIFAILITLVH